ncbi:MAG: hypothetical protein EOP23_03500 [Hyphomicrobiales bacterium]|nr:MAG: hypothetical protein EOP23_03500 [Hyphomicrobiales bacterium]
MLSDETIGRIVAHTEGGAASGCPFCKGRMVVEVFPGEKIRMFSGFKARRPMIVTASKGWSEDEFLASFSDNPDGSNYRVNFRRDRFCYDEDFNAQGWMPTASVDDIDALEESFVETIRLGDTESGWEWNDQCLYPIISTIWHRRLPIKGKTIARTLKAHDFCDTEEAHIEKLIDFGLGILIKTNGRDPIKRKIMPSLQRGRYRTPRRIDLEYKLLGIPPEN